MTADNLLPEVLDFEKYKLTWLYKRYDGSSPQIADRIQIDCEIAIPGTAHRVWIVFSRTERESYPSVIGPKGNRCNLNGMGGGRLHERISQGQSDFRSEPYGLRLGSSTASAWSVTGRHSQPLNPFPGVEDLGICT